MTKVVGTVPLLDHRSACGPSRSPQVPSWPPSP